MLIVALPLLLLAACSQKPATSSQTPAAKAAKEPAPTQVELPSPTEPKRAPAKQVVNLVYSANVTGDVEPCG